MEVMVMMVSDEVEVGSVRLRSTVCDQVGEELSLSRENS